MPGCVTNEGLWDITLWPFTGSYATGSATRAGSRIVNVDPCPWTLSTVRSPPIMWQNARLIASPSPVPPYLLRVDASA
jgi:hypothetical protein